MRRSAELMKLFFGMMLLERSAANGIKSYCFSSNITSHMRLECNTFDITKDLAKNLVLGMAEQGIVLGTGEEYCPGNMALTQGFGKSTFFGTVCDLSWEVQSGQKGPDPRVIDYLEENVPKTAFTRYDILPLIPLVLIGLSCLACIKSLFENCCRRETPRLFQNPDRRGAYDPVDAANPHEPAAANNEVPLDNLSNSQRELSVGPYGQSVDFN